MKLFPVTILDDFYKNPYEIIHFANSLKYSSSEDGWWPGVRTESLDTIDSVFCNEFQRKISNIFFNEYTNYKITFQSFFQKSVPYESTKSSLSQGWVHKDDPMLFAGVIYLNKNPNADSGTSIYSCLNENLDHNKYLGVKQELYLNNIKKEDYDAKYKEFHSNFEESIIVKNKFNRLIMFDGSVYHGANDLGNFECINEERLTQVFFVRAYDLINEKFPIKRSNESSLL